MDKDLKVRKLASASVRKQRSQERAQQRQLLHQEREERKRRMMRMSEIYSTDGSDSSRPNSPENDSSAETPSEYSLKTPDNSFSPHVDISDHFTDMMALQPSLNDDNISTMSKPTILERRRSKIDPLNQVVFGSSLNRLCDFRYDRFSTIIDPIDMALVEQEEIPSTPAVEEEESDKDEANVTDDEEEDDDDEDYSPIELATPVAIRIPMTRPAVVSVMGITASQPRPQKFLVTNINTIMISPSKQSTPKSSVVEVAPTPNTDFRSDYGFPLTEAKPIEANTPPQSRVTDSDMSSPRSLRNTEITAVDNTLKKKSSMPMLTKFTHARMHSIKNFIKPQSISGPPPAVPLIPSSHQYRPSESMSNILLSVTTIPSGQLVADKHVPSSPRRSFTVPNTPNDTAFQERPQTARHPSSSQSTITTLADINYSSMTALPSPRFPISPIRSSTVIVEEPDHVSIKKKGFPGFRRRSGSLGQALKFGNGSKTRLSTLEDPVPPMPVLRAATQESVQSMNFPRPPSRASRQVRKSGMMYSPFPPPTQKGDPVGLGLKM